VKQLWINLKSFVIGFASLDDLTYKPGWNAWTFSLVYLFDYGTHVLTGSAVVSWSRWFYDHRETNRLAAFMDRLLGHVDKDHGMLAGPALWGTVDCHWAVRYLLCLAWAALLWSLL